MTSLRIKVQLGDNKSNNSRNKALFRKFIYVIDSPAKKTIDDLIRTLQEYIIQKFSHVNVRIVQLMTDDGFILSKSDLCSTVLKDSDHLICVDMRKFIDEYSVCFEDTVAWLERKQYDATNNKERTMRIGLSNVPELFIRLYGTVNAHSLYVFGINELITIATEKREGGKFIGRVDNTLEFDQSSSAIWFLECQWEYDANSNRNLFIICTFKIGSSDEVWSNKLQLLLDHAHMRIEKGEITHLAGEANDGSTLTEQQRQRLKELAAKLPPPKRTGPQIDVTPPQNLKLTKHEYEGESSIRMAYGNTNIVTTYQDSSTVEGTFLQLFVISHIVFSKKSTILPEILNHKRSQPVDKPVSVTNLTVFYQMHDGSWHECQDVALAPLSLHDDEVKWSSHSIINIDPDKLISFSIKGAILVKGEAGKTNETSLRVHKKLPQPLKLKLVVTDNFTKQCSLVVEQLNKPLELTTFQSMKQNGSSGQNLLAFVYADDCDNDERIYVSMVLTTENKLWIANSNSRYVSLNRKTLLAWEFNAKQNKTTETPLTDICYRSQSDEIKAVALFDTLTYITYAIRFEVSTKTSKTEETVLIPMDKIQ